MTKPKAKKTQTEIQSLEMHECAVRIVGISPLIMNSWNQKIMEQMLSKHVGKNGTGRQLKKPREIIENAKSRNVNGEVCISPIALKKAMLSASTLFKDVFTKVALRQVLHIEGNSIPLEFQECIDRIDMVRLPGPARKPDVRFRPQFNNWHAEFVIAFAKDKISMEQVLTLLSRAGSGIGVGEFRPEKDGTFGRFRLDNQVQHSLKDVEAIRERCKPEMRGLQVPAWAMDADIDTQVLAAAGGAEEPPESGEAERVG